MFVTGKCKKCGGKPIFDIGDLSVEKAKKIFDERDFGHCDIGWHVEIGKMSDYYEVDWDNLYDSAEKAKEALKCELIS